MTVERWRPFRETAPLREAIERMFEEAWVTPRTLLRAAPGLGVDLYEEEDHYWLEMALPGVRPEDVEVSVEGDTVRIGGEIPCRTTAEGRTMLLHERPCGRFSRTVTLPTRVQADQVQATYENGVLRLRMPKAVEARRRTIPIQAGARPQMAAPAGGQAGAMPTGPAVGMRAGGWNVRMGMEVVGSAGDPVGRVKEVRDRDFLIDRPMARDLYAPFDAIRDVQGDRVILNVEADQVNNQGWASPALSAPPASDMGEV